MNIVVDCESSGPAPTVGDLIQFAAVSESGHTFLSEKLAPITRYWEENRYKAIGITREEHEAYTGEHDAEFLKFAIWLQALQTLTGKQPVFWSDNVAYDWQWINWGLWRFTKSNPFGWSGRRISDLYCGFRHNLRAKWRHLRDTKHTHDPLDDAKGNMEALQKILKMIEKANCSRIGADNRGDKK